MGGGLLSTHLWFQELSAAVPCVPAWMPRYLATTAKDPSCRVPELQCKSGVAGPCRRQNRSSGGWTHFRRVCVRARETIPLKPWARGTAPCSGTSRTRSSLTGASSPPARVRGGLSSRPLPRRHNTLEKPCFSSRRSPAGRTLYAGYRGREPGRRLPYVKPREEEAAAEEDPSRLSCCFWG